MIKLLIENRTIIIYRNDLIDSHNNDLTLKTSISSQTVGEKNMNSV